MGDNHWLQTESNEFNHFQPWQLAELEKCASDFSYFAETYVKIIHPVRGLVPFKLYDFQKRVIHDYDEFKFNIVSKFRQAGLTTLTVVWSLWRCLFRTDQRIMVLSKSDREAIGIGKIVQHVKDNLPAWMQPRMGNDNDHEKEFIDTGGVIWLFTVQGVRSRALTYLIIDEAAFIPNMHDHWKAMYPTLSAGGHCIAISTVNGIGNWYYDTYKRAEEKKNQFHIIQLDYQEHPEYQSREWYSVMLSNLGEKGFAQEILRSFLDSGDTYIPSKDIAELTKLTSDPIRKLFGELDSTKSDEHDFDLPNDQYERGAMWVWKEPEDNHEYVISVDASEGVGEDGDFSAFNIFDTKTLEQVADFYSNVCSPYKLSQVLTQVGVFYNNALVVVENDTGPGLSVIDRLEHTMYYENIYYTQKRNGEKAGVTLNKTLRPVFLETMRTCLTQRLVKINSIRLIRELETFIFDRKKQRAVAQRSKHDDLTISLAICLHVIDVANREIPVGADPITTKISDSFLGSSYSLIRQELEEGMPEDFFLDESVDEYNDILPAIMFREKSKYYRENDALLKSFSW